MNDEDINRCADQLPGARPGDGTRCLPPRVQLRGLCLDAVTQRHCVEHVHHALAKGFGGWIVTPNLDFLRRANHDESFAMLIRRATLVVADGMPLVWASRLQGTPLPERVAGSDLVLSLSQEAARRGRSLYLLGGDEGAAEQAAHVLTERYPGLKIVGHECPPVGFEHDKEQVRAIARRLIHAQPDLVYVALGSPKQELLIGQLRDSLPAAWWIGVGISLGFVSGQVKRAPRWLQRFGLEWVHRLVQEPRRLASRYLVHGLPFMARLMVGSLRARLRKRVGAAAGLG
ncbi:MAG: WecB/TagA/CpsF family glycosyltransferase [Phycisphaera sp.]|nr:WecB/TagA/CpsF family glycosyltransferase [Phycisphaera sp.]